MHGLPQTIMESILDDRMIPRRYSHATAYQTGTDAPAMCIGDKARSRLNVIEYRGGDYLESVVCSSSAFRNGRKGRTYVIY